MKLIREKVKLNIDDVLKYLHYNSDKIDRDTRIEIKESEKILNKISDSNYIYRSFDFSIKNGVVLIKNSNIYFKSKDLKNHLKGAKKLVLFAATLGVEVDKYIKKSSLMDMSKGMIFDASASSFIEEVSNLACDNIEKDMEYKRNFRFAPGYGDLDLNNQSKILMLLDANKKIGLNLSDTNLLIPSKSITGIFGLFEGEIKHKKTCKYCNLKNDCKFLEKGRRCYAK